MNPGTPIGRFIVLGWKGVKEDLIFYIATFHAYCRDAADSWDRLQEFRGGAKGLLVGARLHVADRGLEVFQLIGNWKKTATSHGRPRRRRAVLMRPS